MHWRVVTGAAVFSIGSVVATAHGAGAAPSVERVSVTRADAIWDAGDGTPALAVQAFEGTVDLGSGPQPFTSATVVAPTADGSQTSCSPAGPFDLRVGGTSAALSGTFACADGRTLTVDLQWTAPEGPAGGGTGLRRHGEGPAGSYSVVINETATATGVVDDGSGNLVAGPSTIAVIGRQRATLVCGVGPLAC